MATPTPDAQSIAARYSNADAISTARATGSILAEQMPLNAALMLSLADRLEAATTIPQLPSKPEPSADQYVITTIYTRPDKAPIRHVYGPYDSRSQAARERDRMMAQSEPEADSVLTMFVSKLLS